MGEGRGEGNNLTSRRPLRRVLEAIQHLARFRHEQYAFVLAIREILHANRLGIAIAEIDFFAERFGNARRQFVAP